MKKPSFTVTLSVDEMTVLSIALMQYVSKPLDDAPACAADSLLDKLLAEQEKQMKVWNK